MRFASSLIVLTALALAPAARAADAQAGKAIFDKTCHNCHSVHVGVNKVGPTLWHVVGRPSGTIQGFEYSPAMLNLKTVWTPDALNVYLSNPRGDVHGVKMYFKGLEKPADRANVIAYLESLD